MLWWSFCLVHCLYFANVTDDALGEVLDRLGRLLGVGYPAWAMVEQQALSSNATLVLTVIRQLCADVPASSLQH